MGTVETLNETLKDSLSRILFPNQFCSWISIPLLGESSRKYTLRMVFSFPIQPSNYFRIILLSSFTSSLFSHHSSSCVINGSLNLNYLFKTVFCEASFREDENIEVKKRYFHSRQLICPEVLNLKDFVWVSSNIKHQGQQQKLHLISIYCKPCN